MARLLHLFLCVVGIAIGLLVANRPRFWWQELFHNATLYWLIPACIAALLLIRRMLRVRSWSWLTVVAVIAYVYAIASMGHRVRRYIHFVGWKNSISTASSMSGLWIDSFYPDKEQAVLEELAARFNPSVIVVSGAGSNLIASSILANTHPHRVATSPSADGSIEVLSRLPYASREIVELGFNALPGGVVSLGMPDGQQVELGVLMLQPSYNKASFERNRITSRRLSALMRNSSQRRVVVGDFNATPFSMLSSIFNEQSGMHSLLFKSFFSYRLGALDMRSGISGRNVFVSRDMTSERLEYLFMPDRQEPVVYFSVLSRVRDGGAQSGSASTNDRETYSQLLME
jgi:hypothetical protein